MNAKQRLSELMCLIPDAYNNQIKQGINNPVPDGKYFDCDLYDCQSKPVCPQIERDNYVFWQITYSTGYDSVFYKKELNGGKIGLIGIPKWLYSLYLQGKANYISWRQVALI